jgi:hypothetical protein
MKGLNGDGDGALACIFYAVYPPMFTSPTMIINDRKKEEGKLTSAESLYT